ncbi:MAG: LamG-like jellyroll fold domain-containing protein, partial [Planctomycetota bacterium]
RRCSRSAMGNTGLAEIRFFADALPAGSEIQVNNVHTSNPNGAGSAVRMINGSGLDSENQFHDNSSGNRYTSNFDTSPTLDFQLSEESIVDKIHVWNYTAGLESDRGVRRVRVLSSVGGEEFVDQGIFEIERGGSSQTFYHAINFQTDPVRATHMRFEVLTTWGDNAFTGLGEVKFFGRSIPEPTTTTLSEMPGGITVDSLDVVFSSPVQGVDIGDFQLTRDGVPLNLAAADVIAISETQYRLTDLEHLINVEGIYDLDFIDGDTGIVDRFGGTPLEIDDPFELIALQRVYNRSGNNTTIIPHRDAFLLDEGEVSIAFRPTGSLRGTLFSKDHIGFGTGGHLTLSISNGKVLARLQSATRSYQIKGGAVNANQWNQLQFRFGAGGMRLILNGQEVATDAYTGGLGSSAGGTGNVEDIAIGSGKTRSHPMENTPLRNHFQGRIANVQIRDGEGQIVFSQAQTPFDNDRIDNQFDGKGDFHQIPHESSMEVADGAIGLTFSTDDANRTQALFSKDARGFADGGHVTARLVSGRVEVRLQSRSSSHVVRSAIIQSDRTYQMRFEFGGDGMRLYLDGVLVDTNDHTGGLMANQNDWILGANQWRSSSDSNRLEDYFVGQLGDWFLV